MKGLKRCSKQLFVGMFAIVMVICLYAPVSHAGTGWLEYEDVTGGTRWCSWDNQLSVNGYIFFTIPSYFGKDDVGYTYEASFEINEPGIVSITFYNKDLPFNTTVLLNPPEDIQYEGGAAALMTYDIIHIPPYSEATGDEIQLEKGKYIVHIDANLAEDKYEGINGPAIYIHYTPDNKSGNSGSTQNPDKPSSGSKSTDKSGWKNEAGYWFYVKEDGTKATGWTKVDGVYYFMNSNGIMQKGWVKSGGKWYYLQPKSGAMLKNWQRIGGKWYYLGKDGAMQKGWKKLSGKWYYFDGNGVMTTGWKKIDGSWYYFDGAGVMKKDWQRINGKWYYLKDGAMVTGKQKIAGKWYTFDKNGIWKQ